MSKGANVDIISSQGGSLGGSGPVANRLLANNFNVNALRTNDVLRKEEWEQFDSVLVDVARYHMPLTQELISRGLTYSINNGLGTTILEWEDVSDMEGAQVSLSGVTRGETDTVEFDLHSMPLPIIHKEFTLNIRKLQASRTLGQPLDVTQATIAARKVAETTESMIVAGHATKIGSAVIYGLDTVPNSNARTMTNLWDTTTAAAEYVTDILASIASLQADYMYGPYTLMVNYTTWNRIQNDYSVSGASLKTIAERIMQIQGIEKIIPSVDVPANHAYVVQMTRDVIDEVIGLQPTTVQWETQGGMMMHFKVMSIMIPRVRYTQALQSGITIIS
jgi:uncharacterized linocin/CFP29 family protein